MSATEGLDFVNPAWPSDDTLIWPTSSVSGSGFSAAAFEAGGGAVVLGVVSGNFGDMRPVADLYIARKPQLLRYDVA